MNSIDAAIADRVTIEVNLPPGGPLSGMAADVRTVPGQGVTGTREYHGR